jgi:5'-nucleotidase / UDP-sugar diphosphatase
MSYKRHALLSFLLMVVLLAAQFSFPAAATGSQELNFSVIHTNDEHSAMLPTPLSDYREGVANPSLGGFARLAQYVEDVRAEKGKENEPVLVVSAGDYTAGSPFSWLTLAGGAPELLLLQKIGYDVVTLGNHEFDYGPELLAAYLTAAGYPRAGMTVVASNLDIPQGHPLDRTGIAETYVQTLDNGLKVGFFGLIGVDAQRSAPGAEEVGFLDLQSSAKTAVETLQAAGAQVIICLSHSGVDEDIELARAVPGIHLIIGGHCHTTLTEPVIEGETVIVQTGAYLQNVGLLELAFDPATAKIRVRNNDNGKSFLSALDYRIAAHPGIALEIEQYTLELNAMISRLGGFNSIYDIAARSEKGITHVERSFSSPFGDWVTDAMRQVATEATGEKVDFSFQGNGVIRSGLTPGSMNYSMGEITFYDLVSAIGLGIGADGEPGYAMVSAYVTGEEVRRVLEVSVLLSQLLGENYFIQASGLTATFDPARAIYFWVPVKNLPLPSARAVLDAQIVADDGQLTPLKRGDTQLYHIVTDYYIASFLPMIGEMLPSLNIEIKDKEGRPIELDDAVIYRNGQELKVWQAAVEYAVAQENGQIPAAYLASDRLVQAKGVPIMLWPSIGLLLAAGLMAAGIGKVRRLRKKKKLQKASSGK